MRGWSGQAGVSGGVSRTQRSVRLAGWRGPVGARNSAAWVVSAEGSALSVWGTFAEKARNGSARNRPSEARATVARRGYMERGSFVRMAACSVGRSLLQPRYHGIGPKKKEKTEKEVRTVPRRAYPNPGFAVSRNRYIPAPATVLVAATSPRPRPGSIRVHVPARQARVAHPPHVRRHRPALRPAQPPAQPQRRSLLALAHDAHGAAAG